jgi:hypothetical protein
MINTKGFEHVQTSIQMILLLSKEYLDRNQIIFETFRTQSPLISQPLSCKCKTSVFETRSLRGPPLHVCPQYIKVRIWYLLLFCFCLPHWFSLCRQGGFDMYCTQIAYYKISAKFLCCEPLCPYLKVITHTFLGLWWDKYILQYRFIFSYNFRNVYIFYNLIMYNLFKTYVWDNSLCHAKENISTKSIHFLRCH